MIPGVKRSNPLRKAYRINSILRVLVKYGFEDIAERFGVSGKSVFKGRTEKISKELRGQHQWTRIRKALEELGPTYIKFGQLLSSRSDIFPEGLTTELESLQDKVPPFPADQARTIIREELGSPLEDRFSEIDDTPIASASIAQVYRATLKTGETVAIKVMRPGIRRVIENDIAVIREFAELLEKNISELKRYRLPDMVKEFEYSIYRELDFRAEQGNVKRFARIIEKEEHYCVPRLFEELSSDRMIVLEFIDGIKISNIQLLEKEGYDTALLAERTLDLYFKQIFIHGFYHADPHPGNIFVTPGNKLCLIDFGIAQTVRKEEKKLFSLLVIYIERNDLPRLVKTLQKLSGTPIKKLDLLEYRLAELIDSYSLLPLSEINVRDLIEKFQEMINDHNITVPSRFFLLFKTIGYVEGIVKRLNPQFNLIERMHPYARKLIFEQVRANLSPKEMMFYANDLKNLFYRLPGDFEDLIVKMKEGKVNIHFELERLNEIIRSLDRITNKIVFGMLLTGMVIGSSVIILSGIPPKWNEIPVIGMMGLLFSIFLIVILFLNLIRKRNR